MKVVEVNGRWRIPHSEIERLLSGGGRVKRVAICKGFVNAKGGIGEAVGRIERMG